eukprot:scaffold83253_cov38-Phaeocystis_antarctica.AAC.1
MHLIVFIRARKRVFANRKREPRGAWRRNDTCMLVVHSWTYSPCAGTRGPVGAAAAAGAAS